MTSEELQKSIGQSLRTQLADCGNPLYRIVWSNWDMPAGPQICRQRASARRISGNDCIGWPTVRAQDDGRTVEQYHEMLASRTGKRQTITSLQVAAQLAGWPSPLANKQSPQQRGDFTPNLANVAQLTGWVTPSARDWKDTPGMQPRRNRGVQRMDGSMAPLRAKGWTGSCR